MTEHAHLAHDSAFAVGDLPADLPDRSLPLHEHIVRLRNGDSENVDHTSLAHCDGRGSGSRRLELGRGGDHDFVADSVP